MTLIVMQNNKLISFSYIVTIMSIFSSMWTPILAGCLKQNIWLEVIYTVCCYNYFRRIHVDPCQHLLRLCFFCSFSNIFSYFTALINWSHNEECQGKWETERNVNLTSTDLLLKCPKQPGLGKAKTSVLELHPGVLTQTAWSQGLGSSTTALLGPWTGTWVKSEVARHELAFWYQMLAL